MDEQLVIASASPRRHELLQQIGVHFIVRPMNLDESMRPGEAPTQHVQRLALEKASACGELAAVAGTGLPVLGADTIVELDGEVMGKPSDAAHARAMLTKLSGKTHRVHTAVSLIDGDQRQSALSSTSVTFDTLDQVLIDAYIRTGEPLGKAGAYAIQGRASQFVKSLHGSYSGVVGLPLFETAKLLAVAGIKTL